jgi:hypothetical protein
MKKKIKKKCKLHQGGTENYCHIKKQKQDLGKNQEKCGHDGLTKISQNALPKSST